MKLAAQLTIASSIGTLSLSFSPSETSQAKGHTYLQGDSAFKCGYCRTVQNMLIALCLRFCFAARATSQKCLELFEQLLRIIAGSFLWHLAPWCNQAR